MKATVFALALMCAGAAVAQSPPPAPSAAQQAARQAQHMENLATLLDLTDAQKAQVQTVLQAEHAKMKAAFEQAKSSGTKPDWQQMKALHQQIQQETLQKLGPVLSATQLKKFQVLMQMHDHPHFHHGPRNGSSSTPAPTSG
jgi:Spy/CpxP family protein refolding chaperone